MALGYQLLVLMTPTLFLLACAPRVPPEGSIDISAPAPGPDEIQQVGPLPLPTPLVTGPVPLPLGAALPWEGEPATEAQRAFVAAEAQLAELYRGLEPPMSVEAALDYTERADAIRALLATAATEAALEGPAAARLGDALRIADSACLSVDPPADDTAADDGAAPGAPTGPDREAERAAACAPLAEGALSAYRWAETISPAGSAWGHHARWALGLMGAQ